MIFKKGTFLKKEFRYIPVSTSSAIKFNKDLGWWSHSYFYYPYILISHHYTDNNPRDIIGEDMFLFQDSGGYQMVTQNLNWNLITPKAIMKQALCWNVDLQPILDLPPYEVKENSKQFGSKLGREGIQRCEDYTGRNGRVMLEVKKEWEKEIGPCRTNLYGVVQGSTLAEMESWFSALNAHKGEGNEYDGYALSPKPSFSPFANALHCLFAIQKFPDKPIHIFQTSGVNSLPILAYAQKSMNRLVTCDSFSSETFGRLYRRYLTFNISKKFRQLDFSKNRKETNQSLPCRCDVCSKLNSTNSTHLMFDSGNIGGSLITLHNLSLFIEFVEQLNRLTPSQIYDFVRDEGWTATSNALDFMQYGIENGIQKASDKYLKTTKGLHSFLDLNEINQEPTLTFNQDLGETNQTIQEEANWRDIFNKASSCCAQPRVEKHGDKMYCSSCGKCW